MITTTPPLHEMHANAGSLLQILAAFPASQITQTCWYEIYIFIQTIVYLGGILFGLMLDSDIVTLLTHALP